MYYAEEVDDLFQQLRDELHAVAFSGDYYDLENKPVIISATEPANPVE
ncbi:MAG: hypothetical protein J6T10_21085 [Methanobrevibacter sp.]|nr:hypothetical protein [Methanobrevibacter sp.]